MPHELRASQKCLTTSCSKQEQALSASHHVAHRIAKAKKPHTIAEEILLPAAIDMVRQVIDQPAAGKLKTIPLSNDTIGRRIEEMSGDINLLGLNKNGLQHIDRGKCGSQGRTS